ncbi:MAG TPA: ADP-ribosylglycohydrolase family protein [Fimbriimonadaceae bacterium]|nr:ADP-ribosylglycohydrolase family protein [Fimbriimonadaceae bacterium]
MADNARNAALGALVGWTLGAQGRGRRSFKRLDFFDPIPPRMAQSDAIDAWLVGMAHLKSGGSSASYYRALFDGLSQHTDESAFGLSNVSRGLGTPLCGAHGNPLANGSRAIGRALLWGIVFHGLPNKACEWAYWDASFDHTADGVWMPVAIARAVSLAEPGRAVSQVVRDITETLPAESKLLRAIPKIIKDFDSPDGPKDIRENLPTALGIADSYDSVLTACWVVLGLLRGNGAFEPSVTCTAGCGGASDQAGLACGVISALLSGDVPQAWSAPVGDTFVSGHGLKEIDPPKTVSAFLKLVEEAADAHARQPVEPEPTTEGEGAAPAPDIDESISPEVRDLIARAPEFSVYEHGDIRASFRYIDGPVVSPGDTLRASFTLTNLSDGDVTLCGELTATKGWEIAHKMGEVFLAAGSSQTFAVVVRPPAKGRGDGEMRLSIGGAAFTAPVFGTQLWYAVGPLLNQEGTGFDKEYPAEKDMRLGQVFNGRSNMPVEWTAHNERGVFFDVEGLIGDGPGTAYYFADVTFAKPGRYRIVVASGVGAIVWLDGTKTFWYHDTHTPIPRATEPYIGVFETDGKVKVLIKTFRNLQPIPPMIVYFLAEDGSVAVPSGFSPID